MKRENQYYSIDEFASLSATFFYDDDSDFD